MESEILHELGLTAWLREETGLNEAEIVQAINNDFGWVLAGLFGNEA